LLKLFMEIIVVCSENRMQPINRSQSYWSLKQVVHISTTGL
jgi:hypothetical protein